MLRLYLRDAWDSIIDLIQCVPLILIKELCTIFENDLHNYLLYMWFFYTFCIFRGKKIIHQLLWRKESGRHFMPDAFNVSATVWLKLSFPIWENENNRYVTNENNKMQDPYKSHPLALLILSKHSWNQHLRMLDYPMRKVYSMWRRFNESRR